MKRFQWRLQRVLEIKQKQEQAKRAELEAITSRLRQTRRELNNQQAIVHQLIEELSQKTPQERLVEQPLYIKRLASNDSLIEKLQSEIQHLQRQRHEKMQETLKFKQMTEGLEKLRNRALDEFEKEQSREHQRELDDASAIRFVRGTERVTMPAVS